MSSISGGTGSEDVSVTTGQNESKSNEIGGKTKGKGGAEALSRFARDHFLSKPLKFALADFYPLENASEHFTDDYDVVSSSPQAIPVLRRGFPFHISIHFNRPVDFNNDIIRLKFNFGGRQIAGGTKDQGLSFTVNVTDDLEALVENRWNVLVEKTSDSVVFLQVQIPVSCPVGEFSCDLLTQSSGKTVDIKRHTINDKFFILFNPWHKEDGVYLANGKERDEYVLNDTGLVWAAGSASAPDKYPWVFDQFDESVLQITGKLISLSKLPGKHRGDPVRVARAISAIINSEDEDGLIVGNWSGSYEDGTAPNAWTGSVAIIKEYRRTGKPVKYGQCWVFSALVITVCRALGIPCRTVTNYHSARDTNNSLTIDKYFDANGRMIEGGPTGDVKDFYWNFHVWNDVWMSRPDLPPGYGGWQAIDATPQEKSEKIYRCGPASVEAVRRGEVGLKYDTGFVFAEVNADICYFVEDEKSDWGFRMSRKDTTTIGERMVTTKVKKLDDSTTDGEIEDLTNLYKNSEGSEEDRIAVLNAIRGVELAKKYYNYPDKEHEDLSFDLVEIEDVSFGQPFTAHMQIQNNSNEIRSIAVRLTVNSVTYNGATAYQVKHDKLHSQLQPNESKKIKIYVKPEDYIYKLADHSLIKVIAVATVTETKQTWAKEEDFCLVKPKLNINIKGELRVGKPTSAIFTFQNPLDQPLDKCHIVVEGPGLQKPKTKALRDVEPKEEFAFIKYFTPKKSGSRKIIGNFFSRQLSNVTGSTTVTVLA